MAPIDAKRFIAIMSSSFRYYSDEFWGPIYGPGGPRIHEAVASTADPISRRGAESTPEPTPWRELTVAYEVVKLADALELASQGLGTSLLGRFAEDPDDWCGTRVPGRPRPPKGGNPLNPEVLGAALVFVAAGVADKELKALAVRSGEAMLG